MIVFTSHTHTQVFEYYEELLSSGFPHSSYKLVFVDNSYQSVMNYSSLGIFSTELLHSHRIIDNVQMTRRLIAQAIARQYFGCYMLHQSWYVDNHIWNCCYVMIYK